MLKNTATRYGAVARFFHWSVAVLILFNIALGLVGENTARTADTAGWLQTLYSVHKTIGITVFALAVLRVVWAVSQPKPVPVHPERKAETFLAETVHWMLYGAILVMPLSGWVMHAAESGFAPILWPFGQGLPFVPKSEGVAHMAGAVHSLAARVIYVAVALHVAGALKHAVIERDGVLARMLKGVEAGRPEAGHVTLWPALAGLMIWAAVVAVPFVAPAPERAEGAAAPVEQAQLASGLSVWRVEDGSLTISVQQMGAAVGGRFDNWSAAIAYDEESGTGEVTVMIDTTSLTLGAVTDQAKGAEFFDTENFSTAQFEGEISRVDGAVHEAVGMLTLVGQEVLVTLAFDLEIEGDAARMTGTTVLDRRDFGMGAGYEDESTVGFAVKVETNLTAIRQ